MKTAQQELDFIERRIAEIKEKAGSNDRKDIKIAELYLMLADLREETHYAVEKLKQRATNTEELLKQYKEWTLYLIWGITVLLSTLIFTVK